MATYVVRHTPINDSLESGQFEFVIPHDMHADLLSPEWLATNFIRLLVGKRAYILEEDHCVIRCVAWCPGLDGVTGFVMENTDHGYEGVYTFAGVISPQADVPKAS